MPSYRSKMSCAYRAEPLVKRPKKILTEDEKEDAKMKREINKMVKESRTKWESTLPGAWIEGPNAYRHPRKHLCESPVMFKSDAKKSFSLTETDILTLRHESIPSSLKTYFALADVKALQKRKFDAGALLEMDVKGTWRVSKSMTSAGRRCNANFSEVYNGDARVFELMYGPNGRITQAKAKAAL
ncbi:hypothetical protein C8R43DRAFT_1045353 [Mycena crocata]|nr:hypothetical protein C8R43DRAFT_1045353 [Mycena crocata]